MRRKLVRQGQNALTVTLPAKWAQRNSLKAGDEVEIDEEPRGNLLITSKLVKPVALNSQTVDIEGKNKYQIVRLVRGMYRSKVDELVFRFKTTKIKDLKNKKTVDLFSVCEAMTKKLIGLEITHKSKEKIVFQCFISREDEQSIRTIEKRIFLRIKEFMNEILENLDDFSGMYERYYDIHDSIAKFCDYYMRAVVHSSLPSDVKAANYSLMVLLDKLVDLLRYVCVEINRQKKLTPKAKEYLTDMFKLFDTHYKYFYSIEGVKSADLTNARYELLHRIQAEKFTVNEQKLISEASFVLHLMNDFHEVKRIRTAQEDAIDI